MKTIKEWQRDAYALAVEKGFHSRECTVCDGSGDGYEPGADGPDSLCSGCDGSGRVPIDPHSPTRIASRLALIHCEISEAVECVARGRMDRYWVSPSGGELARGAFTYLHDAIELGYKPEGFPIELADVFLRLCDLAESLGLTMVMPETDPAATPETDPETQAAMLNELHDTMPPSGALIAPDMRACNLTDVAHLIDWRACRLNDVLHELFSVADATGVDLLAMAELKHSYNKSRPYKHGKVL